MRTGGRLSASWVVAALIVGSLGGARLSSAQTSFVPYFGKNLVRYNKFEWHIYTTEHFELYYYPEIESHLERLAGYAESAYQQVSSDLKHDLAFKVPLILFKTHSEFEQENVIPGAAQEGVAAFAESLRNRMLLPLDEPPDLLYRTITHELTHIFEFDIIPQSLIRRNIPLWAAEGLSDYETGYWAPIDLMTVRDAAVADIVPKMSEMEEYGESNNPRLVYNLGHAAYEFIESRWGKEGMRQFLFALRKSVIGGGESAYEDGLRLKPDEFDQQFEKYLKDRFKPFRDKERPADYGRNLAPNPEKGRFANALSVEPSPSGDLVAMATGNRNDGELDILLVSAKDGTIVRNLTPGFDQDMGFQFIATPGSRWNTVPWMAWSPAGDRLAFFVRTKQFKTLILENVLSRKVEQRVDMKTIDEPESPSIAPGGQQVAFGGLQNGRGDIFLLDLGTEEITNLTNDDFTDSSPTFSPDGKTIIYLSRVSGNEKLFKLDLATKKKTQITFGTHDDGGAKFLDADTIVFPSTAVDPAQPITPEVARNGNIYNLWTLSLSNGQLQQYTDALGGNLSPVVLNEGTTRRVAFVTYYKGDYELHTLDRKEPLHAVASADFGAPGPIIDFQAPLTHTLVKGNAKKKGAFEKLFLDSRPPINVGVTSGGDFFGGSELSFADVLGDHRFNLLAESISQYRTIAGSYVNLSHRLQYALQGYSQTLFYYGQLSNILYDASYSPFISRDMAVATRTVRGGSVFGIYPLDTYRRLEMSAGVMQYNEQYNDPGLQSISSEYQQQAYGQQLFSNGTFVPFGVAFIQETTVFRDFGPLAGNTLRLGYDFAPKIAGSLSRQTFDADARYYLRLSGSGLLALRFRGFKSWGGYPDFLFFGGNSEMRGYEYLEFIGNNDMFANAELRFPLVHAMLTPIGVMGGVRGVFFANIGGGWFNGTAFKFWSREPEYYQPLTGYIPNYDTGVYDPVYGASTVVSGFRLRDGRASYGIGLETFVLGFPIHFDWSWRTLFNKQWEDLLFAESGGSSTFRKPKFSVWIGYDF